MKKLLLLLLLILCASASAEEISARVEYPPVSLTVQDCRIEIWQQESEAEGYFETEILLNWKMGNSSMDDMEGYFFDISGVAHSGNASAGHSWTPGYDLRPAEQGLVMGYIPALYDQWTINEDAALTISHEMDGLEFPFEIAFQVDLYEPLVKTSDLRLDKLVWRMQQETDRIFVAKPDIPDMNGGSDVPKVLEDFHALMDEGGNWESRLQYQRERAQLRRMVMKINKIAKHLVTWEVHIAFDRLDQPGRVSITEIK